ncbi:hypothetical protein ACFY1P_20350 [Streptomyces sp. NPDC001407]|uniref:hypothetical protein n=1 Tax=Streptomyces sp. NPDC001407 TaxID=3364573 RepID=UPI0036991810
MSPDQRGVANAIEGQATVSTSVQARDISTLHVHPAPTATDATPPVPYQLPPVPVAFTGRNADVEDLSQWLREQPSHGVRLASLSGAGGVGKTALATWWLHRLRHQFPGGQLFADLRGHAADGPARTDEVLVRLLRSCRTGPLPATTEELSAWWRSVTAARPDKPVCLLLDNAASAEQIRTLLPGGDGHLVVVTSRELLADLARDGARLHQLRPLDPAAASEYLARCLGSGRITREPDAARQIAATTLGLPLALGLVVTELAAHPGRPLADLLTSSAGPDAGAAPRHRADSLEGAMAHGLDRVYWHLPRDVARVYRRLALLPLPETDTALTAAICNLTAEEAHQALRALSAARLLEDVADHPVRGRVHRLHDASRAHARAQARHEDTDGTAEEVLHRALDWFQTGATAAEEVLTPAHRRLDRPLAYPPAQPITFTQRTEALAWLDGQQTQLMAAIRAGHAAGLYPCVWMLVWALWPLWHHSQAYSLWLEAHRLAVDAAHRDRAGLPHRALLNTYGVGLRSAGQHDAAIEAFTRVRDMATAAADAAGQAQAVHELGVAHHGAGRRRQAHDLLLTARQQRVELDDLRGQALTDIVLGEISLDDSQPDQAITRFTTARALLLQVDDPHNAARALAWLGRAHALSSDTQVALDHGRTAVEEFTQAGSRRWIARSLEMLGQTNHEAGHVPAARDLFTQSLNTYEPFSSRDADRLRGRLRDLP